MRKSLLTASLLALAVAAPMAHAFEAGDIIVRAGAITVDPQEDSSELKVGGADVAGTKATLDSDTQLGLNFAYMITNNIGIELLAATPFSHDVSLNGAKAGSFKHLPPTVSLQHYFNADGKVSPFVGAGLNYTWTFSEDSTNGGPISGADLSIGNSFGFAGQLGLRFSASKDWDVVVDARYIDISADVSVNGTNVGEATVDPMVYSIMVGKRF